MRKERTIISCFSPHSTRSSRSSPIRFVNYVRISPHLPSTHSFLRFVAIQTWKSVLKRLCIFIDHQLHRSPRDHTREMHSTCVATYNTLMTLIIERPTLLEDQENLFRLCEIIELGISGEKAEAKTEKGKEYRPASQRVAEAAEHLMCVLFEHKVNRTNDFLLLLLFSSHTNFFIDSNVLRRRRIFLSVP